MKSSKNIVITLLCLQFIYPFFAVNIIRLPNLFIHFVSHNVGDKKIDFLDFLDSHYQNKEHKREDKSHKSLPFQNHSMGFFNPIFGVKNEVQNFNFHLIKYYKKLKINLFYQNSYFSDHIFFIWKPPKGLTIKLLS